MKPDQTEFEELRRLLAIKRHEAPPPGYFHFFSRRVIARIEAGETAADESAFQRLIASSTWLQQLMSTFESRPVFSGAVSMGLLLLALGGLWHSEPSAAPSIGSFASPLFHTTEFPADTFYPPAATLTSYSSTNGLLPQHLKSDSLFEQYEQNRGLHMGRSAIASWGRAE